MDHSDRDRQRMLDAIDQLTESDTRDELGLGSIRDGFSELFFPGTNTIQTRARYFLFVPWVYKAIEESHGGKEAPWVRARRDELALCDALCRSDDVQGVIGSQARASLKRLPSNIYWLGLQTWEIRRFSGSQEDYHERLKRPEAGRVLRDDDGALLEGESERGWHGHLPKAPKDFLKACSLALTRSEAEYLRDRLTQSRATKDSLLSHLVSRTTAISGALPWLHPEADAFPAKVREHLAHARLFSETLYGAALLYNVLLTEALNPSEAQEEQLSGLYEEVESWCGEMAGRGAEVDSWDRGQFWQLAKGQANVRSGTERFVNDWWRLSPWKDPQLLRKNATVRQLVAQRELTLKGGRARLKNKRALEEWKGAAGLGRMNYRWFVTRRIVSDIHAGLNGGADANPA
jgi:hypothetical protein